MTLASPAGLLLGLLAIPIVLLHMLRPRRPPVEVGSTFLWREIASPVSAASPWQRLRPTALLAVQLLVVAMFAVAAARPVRHTDAPLAAHTVFILDASASMGAAEGRPDRLAEAKAEAVALRRQLPAGGVASLVIASSEPRVALSASGDRSAFEHALEPLEAGGGAADFQAAFTLAESLETQGTPVSFVLLSDGGMTSDERAVIPPGTRYVRIGQRSDNRAISHLAVQTRSTGLHAVVAVRNTGPRPDTSTLRMDVDGRTAGSATITVKAGGTVQKDFDLPPGDRVVATLEGADLLASDNRAFAAPAPRRTVKVLLAGPDNVYVEGLLRSIPGVEVDRTPLPAPAGAHDLVVYAGVDVPPEPGAPFLAIAPPHGAPGVAVKGAVDEPAVTLLRADDPWLTGLDLADVAIARAQRVDAPSAEVLLGTEGAPLLLRGTQHGKPFAYLSFRLEESNLPLDVAFPILGNRVVEGLTSASAPETELVTGQPLPLGSRPGAVTVLGPGGIRRDVAPGAPAPVASQPGFWMVEEAGRPGRLFAVNPDPAESSLAPVERLPIRRLSSRPGERLPAGEASLLAWAAGALLVLLAVELLMSRRSSGAPRRQRRAAMVLRGATAALIVLALVGAGLVRPGRRVATVFLIDASDSMGAAGRGEAVDWVRTALERQPADALAGVALFGADARVELTMQHEAVLDQPAARVVGTGTNLANALRLAGAVLPADSRRRVVVVSDGRMTDGDAAGEIKRLRAQGVRLDVHPVGRAGSADVAVSRLDAPASVREGESYRVRATLTATASGEAHLALQRDGVTVDERTVAVRPGDTVADFEQPAGPAQTEGVHRFRLEVSAGSIARTDGIPENDVGFTAVRIGGRERVLVAEGASGDARDLAAALRSAGLPVDVIPAAALPPADQLSTYSATVLVDVDARSLSPDQVEALGAATRDLGRGLVVLGGDRSYSLGGYLGSGLEGLLPVVSEVKDPIRRKSVAEVLAIDTSGSMGACHCNPDGAGGMGGNRMGGGINKTDISRAGAARAIAALSAQDQVGVLAFNTEQRWILPLQQLPAADVVQKGLQQLTPAGGTSIPDSLAAAATALRSSKANLRHIILFTDGWTNQEGLAAQAAALYEEGITVSVLATGEGPGNELQSVADAGHGRFYPGRDLEQVPRVMMEEAALASRNLVNEGEFFPRVLSQSAPVAGLTQSPALLGYLATTSKPSATTLLDLGPDHDPLLATWRIGLGKATAWTSDASERWSQRWAAWDGYGSFWTGVVKDTFPLIGSEGSGVRAEVSEGRLRISAESEQPWPDGAEASARVSAPGGGQEVVTLERASATTFAGEAPAPSAGTYAVGVEVHRNAPGPGGSATGSAPAGGQQPLLVATAFASQSYSPEYRPGAPDPGGLVRLSRLSGGRGAIQPAAAFDQVGLPTGRRTVPLTGWFLLAAALLWPVDVALRRLALHGAAGRAVERAREHVRTRMAALRPPGATAAGSSASSRRPALGPGEGSSTDRTRSPRRERKRRAPAPQAPATVQRLLERKQGVPSADDAGTHSVPPETGDGL